MATWRWLSGGLAAAALALDLLGGFGVEGLFGQRSEAFAFGLVSLGIALTFATVARIAGSSRWAGAYLRSLIALEVVVAMLVICTAVAGVGRLTETYDFVRAPSRTSFQDPRKLSPEGEGKLLIAISAACLGLFAGGVWLTAREIKRVASRTEASRVG